METRPSEISRRGLPLSFVLEGKSWMLTAALESTIAIWMVALAADGYGFFISKVNVGNNWGQELFQYLLYMLVGAISAAITVGALSLNFRPMDEHTWRKRSCRSIFALVIVDLMAVDHVISFVDSMVRDIPGGSHERITSLVATGFLSIVGFCCTIYFNYIFVKEFGCCICCRKAETGQRFVHRAQTWASMKEHLEIPSAQPSLENEEIPDSEATVVQIEVKEGESSSSSTVQTTPPIVEDWKESVDSNGAKDEVSTAHRKLKRLTTKTLIEIGSTHTRAHSVPITLGRSLPMSEITEEVPPSIPTPSVREKRKVSFGPDITQTIQKFLHGGADQTIMSLFGFSRASLEKLWDAVKEEPGHFRYAVWIKSSFFTSVVVLIYACIKSLAIIFSLVSDYEDNRIRISDNMTELDEFFMDSGWVKGTDSVARKTVIRLYLLLDKIILDYKWTALIGYPLGTAFGLCSLIAVLVQHKRISLAVSHNLNVFKSQRTGPEQTNEQWLEFQRRYPILEACLFLAILSSTAVLQAQIVAATISFFLGLIINVTAIQVLLELYGKYLLAYLAVFIIDVILMRTLKSSLITDDGYGIKHPRWFNFFMVILSMVHLVIGILYALWRVVYLTVTTVFVLNRLDVSLFTVGKTLDTGHNVFMSMLVLTVLIQQDTDKCANQDDPELNETIS